MGAFWVLWNRVIEAGREVMGWKKRWLKLGRMHLGDSV